jgi:hypothetical protein
MEYNNRNYVVFSVTELDKIDFTQVLETSADTVRKSVDSTLTFVKWDGPEVPLCVQELETKSDYLNHEEMLELLSTDPWVDIQAEMV